MKFWILAENTSLNPRLESEHGLSILAEWRGKRILFDMGKTGLFAENAEKLGLPLDQVETAILSHGHYDHAGGLPIFLEKNSHAELWMQQSALEPHFSHRPSGEDASIGVPPLVISRWRLHLLEGDAVIEDGMQLFSRVQGKKFWPQSNQVLLKKEGDQLVEDDFLHEQNLLLEENGKSVLLTGCSHCGVLNILQEVVGKTGRVPDILIGGFHLSMPSAGKSEPLETVRAVGEALKQYSCRYYTGHCTGTESYLQLKEILGDQLQPISTGLNLIF
ncbi:MAG: MBL fold metallo-hydrolase [Candidatus Merdivicinus sp.]|jgi:7,8-dihydropterin-6-yl-methyl-4-(beta-D-ribofuranosyl)aminobenzene 5'-phosphate synthase